jgi:hypothetical protein
MPVHRGERRSEAHRSNDDENDRKRVAEGKVATAHLIEEEEHAHGNNDGGAHQAANGAAAARATGTITHRCSSSKTLPPKNGR